MECINISRIALKVDEDKYLCRTDRKGILYITKVRKHGGRLSITTTHGRKSRIQRKRLYQTLIKCLHHESNK